MYFGHNNSDVSCLERRVYGYRHSFMLNVLKPFRRIKDILLCISEKFCDDCLVFRKVISNFIFQPRFHVELYTSLFKPFL